MIMKEMNEEIEKLLELISSETGKKILQESIAEVFHDSWVDWSKQIDKEETLSDKRRGRWNFLWNIPYCQIPDAEKKPELELARRVMLRLGIG